MSPKYKLTYFDAMALAEPIRLIFAHLGIEYEDIRVTHEEWPALKSGTPWGSIPILEEDGKVLAQSVTIVRYLGRKYGLAPKDEFLIAKCNEYIDAAMDVRNEAATLFREQDETIKATKKKNLDEVTIPRAFKVLDDTLKKNGTGFLVGSSMSYSDITIGHLIQLFGRLLSLDLSPYPALKAHQDKIFNSPGIKEWVAKRPVTQF